MTRLPCIHFYPGDWLRDNVSGCSLAAQGLWLRMMILMHDCERYGYLAVNGSPIPQGSIAQRCGCTLEQYEALLAELTVHGVPGVSQNGTIYSRRMVRDAEIRAGNAKRQLRHRRSVTPLSRSCHGDVTPNEDEDETEDEKKGKKTEEEYPSSLPDGFKAEWLHFREHRRKIRSPMTKRTEELLIAKFAQRPAQAIAGIRTAMELGWRGFEWEWFDEAKRKKGQTPPAEPKKPPKPQPPGWSEWLQANYPEAKESDYWRVPGDVQREFHERKAAA